MSIHRLRVHKDYVEDCFACKISTVVLSNMVVADHIKRTDRELDAYRSARKDGIQPATTKMKDIQKAVRTADQLGRAVSA